MSVTKNKKWTYEDYYRLDDDKRYELIEGDLIEMAPAPTFKHQTISAKLFNKLYNFLEEKQLGFVRSAPLDIIFDEQNTLQPDIIFISNNNQHIIQERGVFGSPDLVIEILSPSTIKRDKDKKFKIYEQFGVQEYWIVDPEKESIEIFVLDKKKFSSYCSVEATEKVKSKLIPEFSIYFSQLL